MTFSIIIPVYNSAEYIKKCIDSIKVQTFSDFEVLLINDGSTDNSEKIIHEMIDSDSRFRIINQKNNGVSAARNNGLLHAKNEYIIFIDSDDWIEPNLLEEIVKINNNYDIIQYDFYKATESSKKEIHIKSELSEIIQGEGAVVWKRTFKRKLLDGITFDVSIKGGEDYLFCVYAFLKTNSFYYLNKCLYNYNIGNQCSLMHSNFIGNLQDQLAATKKVEMILKDKQLIKSYVSDLDKRYYWCLIEFNNWFLSKKIHNTFFRKIILIIIKFLLK